MIPDPIGIPGTCQHGGAEQGQGQPLQKRAAVPGASWAVQTDIKTTYVYPE